MFGSTISYLSIRYYLAVASDGSPAHNLGSEYKLVGTAELPEVMQALRFARLDPFVMEELRILVARHAYPPCKMRDGEVLERIGHLLTAGYLQAFRCGSPLPAPPPLSVAFGPLQVHVGTPEVDFAACPSHHSHAPLQGERMKEHLERMMRSNPMGAAALVKAVAQVTDNAALDHLPETALLGTLATLIAGGELVLFLCRPEMGEGEKPTAAPAPSKAPAKAAPSPPPPLSFDAPKHWIGVKVVDEDGNTVKDVTVQCSMDDGFAFPVDLSKETLEGDGSYKTGKVLDGANCAFSFPSLFDVEWWPQGGSAGKAASVTATPPAEDGDCLLSIADRLGFRSYHSIWDQPQNNTLKKDRPNPNMLVKGDVLNAPDQNTKVEKKPLDQTWTFVVKNRKPFKLSLVLIDKDDKPLSGKQWELKTPVSQKGATGGDGLAEITGLKPGDKAATLKVTMEAARTPPNKIPPAAPAGGPPPYPPAIVAADFKDKMPDPDYSEQVVEWNLTIGGMPSFNDKTGVLARLHNLGFGCDIDSDDETASRAVKAYQNLYMNNKNGSGLTADIQNDLRPRHDQA